MYTTSSTANSFSFEFRLSPRGFFLFKISCWPKRAPIARGSQRVPKDIATFSFYSVFFHIFIFFSTRAVRASELLANAPLERWWGRSDWIYRFSLRPAPTSSFSASPFPPSHCFISASQAHGRVPRRPIGTDLRFHFFLSQYLILAGQPEHLQGLRMHLFLFLSEETRLLSCAVATALRSIVRISLSINVRCVICRDMYEPVSATKF